MASILIVDDEKNIRTMLASYLRGLGHATESAADGAAALETLAGGKFDVVFSDVRMAGLDGLALLGEIKGRRPETFVVLMTAYATVAQAVEAMRAGAYDYLVKPFSVDQVGLLLERVLEVQLLRRENVRLRRAVEDDVLLDSSSAAMQRAIATAKQAASSDVTMLLTGESGTGKTVLARQIHRWSARHGGPFVTIPCTTLADHLLESELFGHVKGAFTGAWKDKPGRVEAAAGGTLFLDEAGELSPELQSKLLRFLEERAFERVGGTTTIEIDTRLIAATNRDLEADVRSGKFRKDLYFRLNVVAVGLPPLRERRDDVRVLAERLLARLAARHGREALQLSPEALHVLGTYEWPGNVRELENALERAIVLSPKDVIHPEAFPDGLLAPVSTEPSEAAEPSSLEQLERRHIQRVLAESATLEEAATRLGIDVTTLWRKRKRYALD